jgi:hypothetical protein
VGYDLEVNSGLGRVCMIVIFTAKISSINPPLRIRVKSPPLLRERLRQWRGARRAGWVNLRPQSNPQPVQFHSQNEASSPQYCR